MPPPQFAINHTTPTLSHKKRKRELDDTMDRENVMPKGDSVLSPLHKLGQAVFEYVRSPFRPPAKTTITTGVPSKHERNKRLQLDMTRHIRAQTPLIIPGAFPTSPSKTEHPAAPANALPRPRPRPTQSSARSLQHPRKSSLQATADAKLAKWDRIGQDVSRREPAKRLPRPSPRPPSAKMPGTLLSEQRRVLQSRPRRSPMTPIQQDVIRQSPFSRRDPRGAPSKFPSMRSPALRTHDIQLPTPSSSGSSKPDHSFYARGSQRVADDSGNKGLDIGVSVEIPELEEFSNLLEIKTKRSEKLERRIEELKQQVAERLSRREHERLQQRKTSPGLQEAIEEVLSGYQERKNKEAELGQKSAKADVPKSVQPPPPFVRLPSEEALALLSSLDGRAENDEIHVYGKTPVTPKDFATVKPYLWLNDGIINAWFDDLCRQARTKFQNSMDAKGTPVTDGIPRYHAFNTNWWSTITEKSGNGVNKISRWAKRAKVGGADLLKVHKLLIPMHLGNHWTLLVILPQRRLVRYYDSFNVSAIPYLQAAEQWISHELNTAKAWNPEEWTFEGAKSSYQQNTSDCGVYSSLNALATFYAENLAETVPSEPMATARSLMMAILLSGGFQGEFDLEKWYPGFRLETDRVVMNGTSKTERHR